MIIFDNLSFKQIKAHAEYIFPDECCGFLFGTEHPDGTRVVEKLKEVKNAQPGDQRRRFEITGKDYMLAEKFAVEQSLTLLGVYHSHPNHPAIPSEHDRIAALPYFSYVIVSVMNGSTDEICSWRLNEVSQFEEEKFSLI
jgi:proteasome lid subunit RPN8/RPN11